ncbi:lytic transglycosylase domain-containing protein [Streptomyces massasporeus]|uniref:lytic transglycosylase domain-containing protein n=1 Tax=Streptomyces massasporeus TaxID=67324 RepID=UPI0037215441
MTATTTPSWTRYQDIHTAKPLTPTRRHPTTHSHAEAEGGSAADIPPRMLTAYRKAAQQVGKHVPKCQDMRWPILAGVAKVESNHAIARNIADNGDIRPKIYGVLLNGSDAGGNTTVFPDTDNGRWDGTASSEPAVGPFQFLPSTWEGVGKDANGDKPADPHNADDAALGAAIYLCGNGRDLTNRSQLKAAFFQYNRSQEYVANVLGWVDQYTAAAKDPNLKNVTGKVRTVIEAALSARCPLLVGRRQRWRQVDRHLLLPQWEERRGHQGL